MIGKAVALSAVLGLVPTLVLAQDGNIGPVEGEREFSLSGTGSSDRKFDSASLGVSADLGWYLTPEVVVGVRQSVNYASIEGEGISDDFWNGATRGYADYHFDVAERTRPFVGASLGAIYGDGVNDGGFAGLELGLKYYVRTKTFITGRAEYQWFFDSASDVDDTFDDGAWAYTVGLGYHF